MLGPCCPCGAIGPGGPCRPCAPADPAPKVDLPDLLHLLLEEWEELLGIPYYGSTGRNPCPGAAMPGLYV